MELRGRLKLIENKVPACDILCDIGTDHGYLPIALMERDRCTRAIAADVGKGPLMAAQRNIEVHNQEEWIETRLGDGLKPIALEEMDVAVIAGMGGILIKEILEASLEKAKAANCLVLQPMNALEILREWLYGSGFEILDEELASEGEKIYHVMTAKWTGQSHETDPFHYHIGIRLIEKRDPLLKSYLSRRINLLKKAVKEMETAGDSVEQERNRYQWLIERMEQVKNEL